MSTELGIVFCVLAGLFLLGLMSHKLWPAAVAVILVSIALGLFDVDWWWLLTIAGAIALVLLLFRFIPLRRAIAIAAIFIISAGAAVVAINVNIGNGSATSAHKAGLVPSINVLSAGKGCDRQAVAAQALRDQGFTNAQFVMGEANINWSAPEANERGDASFSSVTPTTAKAVVAELNSDNQKAKAAREALLKESGATPEQLADPNNWVPAQLQTESDWKGNTAYQNGTAVAVGTRESASDDVVWLFVRPDVCVQVVNGQVPADDAVTGHRAGCGNPQLELPTPKKPPVTTTTTPKSPPTTTTTKPCEKPPKPAVTDPRYDWQWNASACKWEQRDNPFYQPQQHNPGQNTGPTPGAPQQPTVPSTGATPPAGSPAPAPTPNGTDSGSSTTYPGGTTTGPNGSTSGGGPSGPTDGEPPVVDGGTYGGNTGGFG